MWKKGSLRSYSGASRNYLIFVALIVILSFLIVSIIFESKKYTSDINNLRKQIYKEKQSHIKSQVDSAIKTVEILRDSLEERMHADLRNRVDEAYSIAVNLYNKNKNKFTDKQIQEIIKEALRPVSFFNGRGYYYILSKKGYNILHPIDDRIEGENVLNLRNTQGGFPIRKIVKAAKANDEGCVTYYWKLPNDTTGYSHEKTSYFRNLPFYGWFVGTGDYLECHKNDVKKSAIKKITAIRYDDDGYIFVLKRNGNVLTTRNSGIANALSFKAFKDADGKELFPIIDSLAFQKGEGFYTYRLYLESRKEVRNLQSYVKRIKCWDWAVGGFTDIDTAEDIIKSNKANLQKDLYISLLLILFILAFLMFLICQISKRISGKIEKEFNRFYCEFEQAVNTNSCITEMLDGYKERQALVRGINTVLIQNNDNISRLQHRESELVILNASKDRFFSIIAHDLKNPFNSLIGILEILLEDYDELDDEERKQYLGVLNESSNKLFTLLTELLQWASLQTSGIECDFKELSILCLVENEVKTLDDQRKAKNIDIKVDILEEQIVLVDRNMISTVIRNLLSNAIKFTNNKGKINIYSRVEKNNLILSIEDNGLGISKRNLLKLFKIEEKITSVGTNEETGTGLGLILCKEFVEKNNGEINVLSEEGKGSIFSFSIPIV
jgi:signal transduction histidine kinase